MRNSCELIEAKARLASTFSSPPCSSIHEFLRQFRCSFPRELTLVPGVTRLLGSPALQIAHSFFKSIPAKDFFLQGLHHPLSMLGQLSHAPLWHTEGQIIHERGEVLQKAPILERALCAARHPKTSRSLKQTHRNAHCSPRHCRKRRDFTIQITCAKFFLSLYHPTSYRSSRRQLRSSADLEP
jgi:hypothetical protein